MTTLRQAHRKKYTSISNTLSQDNTLSLTARGLMLYLLSLPDDWKVHVNHLVSVMKEGKHRISNALKELKLAGYVHHHKEGFQGGWTYFIFEESITKEKFKEFLRTNRFSNNSISEQFEDQPLQNTNEITKKENLLHKETQEEDFSNVKKKNSRIRTVQRVLDKWKSEGRDDHLIQQVVDSYVDQVPGSVLNIPKWMESVYLQKQESSKTDGICSLRRAFALSRPSNYIVKDDKITYISGNYERTYSLRGDNEFWRKHNL